MPSTYDFMRKSVQNKGATSYGGFSFVMRPQVGGHNSYHLYALPRMSRKVVTSPPLRKSCHETNEKSPYVHSRLDQRSSAPHRVLRLLDHCSSFRQRSLPARVLRLVVYFDLCASLMPFSKLLVCFVDDMCLSSL